MESFFGGLPDFEMQALVDAPGVITDPLYVDLMRAYALLQPSHSGQQELLLQRLQRLQSLLGDSPWSENLLYTYQGNLKYELVLSRAPIRKVRKFSGWVRNSSAVGSKRKSGLIELDPEIFETYVDVEDMNFYNYLTCEDPDFDDLGIPAGTYLYPLLKSYYDSEKPIPIELRQRLFL